LSIKELRRRGMQCGLDFSGVLEKQEMVKALVGGVCGIWAHTSHTYTCTHPWDILASALWM